ncbi:MAG: 5'-nucleotidase, lipoprotein e(P4) family [Marinilabiliales bacterium]
MKNQLKLNIYHIILCIPLIFAASCKSDQNTKVISEEIEISTQNAVNADHLIMSVLWFQHSAENKALFYQAYNMAKYIVVNKMKNINLERLPAVVFDIDETILDNSPFEAECIKQSRSYSKEFWLEWTAMKKAKALPGTIDFINFLDSLGIEAIFITNRLQEELEVTFENMKNLGFKNIKKENFLMKTETSSKESRRQLINEKYNVLLYVGDNLADYQEIYEACKTSEKRSKLVDIHKDEFGVDFIILPNPMYGDWEKELYNCNHDLTNAQKDSIRRAALIGF